VNSKALLVRIFANKHIKGLGQVVAVPASGTVSLSRSGCVEKKVRSTHLARFAGGPSAMMSLCCLCGDGSIWRSQVQRRASSSWESGPWCAWRREVSNAAGRGFRGVK
jgi:hypothetical protein